MSHATPSYRALAVHYGERETTLREGYYRWSSYGEPDGPLLMNYYFWVLEPLHDLAAPPIVVDCGFDPGLAERTGRRCLCAPRDALRRLGIDPAAVALLLVTHVHWDHVGNVQLFANARIAVTEADFTFWTADPLALRPQFAEHSDPAGIEGLRAAQAQGRVALLGDRTEVAPGITAIRVGGHTPGQLILTVPGEHGPLVLASDAIHYYDELERDRPFGLFSNLAEMYRGYDTVRELSASGATIVAGHDPLVMERFPPVSGDGAEIAVRVSDTRRDR
jgi:glyoxylase-like metal-dependent hydrolase (beta-lactamase superfamily II)